MKLNFACGSTRWAGFENSDVAGGDRVVDLRERPYPYHDESAQLILLSHAFAMTIDGVLALGERLPVLREFHRILRPGGWLRLDDNPSRIFRDGETVPDALEESTRGFPPELRVPRDRLVAELREVGFDLVNEVGPESTTIPGLDAETRAAVVGNHLFHVSFALEAQK